MKQLKATVNASDGLWLRQWPEKGLGSQLVILRDRTPVIAFEGVEFGPFQFVKAPDAYGWMWKEFLSIQMDTPTRIRHLGVHSIGHNPALIDLCRQVHIPFITQVNEPKMVAMIREVSPTTFIMYRDTSLPKAGDLSGNNPTQNGYQYLMTNRDHYLLVGADCYSIHNEWLSYDDPRLLDRGFAYYEGLMQAAKELRIKIAVGDLSVGHPALALVPHYMGLWQEVAKGGHYANIHIYDASPDLPLANAIEYGLGLVANIPNLKVIIGEYAAYPNTSDLFHFTAENNLLETAIYNSGVNVIGAARYTLTDQTGEEWRSYDFKTYLAAFSEWLK